MQYVTISTEEQNGFFPPFIPPRDTVPFKKKLPLLRAGVNKNLYYDNNGYFFPFKGDFTMSSFN